MKPDLDSFRRRRSWKNVFSEKADVRYTLAGCSRMRVGEGSSEKKEIEKMRNIFKNTWKKGIEKVMQKTLEDH